MKTKEEELYRWLQQQQQRRNLYKLGFKLRYGKSTGTISLVQEETTVGLNCEYYDFHHHVQLS